MLFDTLVAMRRLFVPALCVAALAAFVSPVLADTVGQTQSFLVNTSYDASGAGTVSAILRAAGSYGYFYIDDLYWATLSPVEQSQFNTNLNALSVQFDSTIYPRVTSFYGSENTPGIDADPHVVVMMERLISGSGGYFETIHNYTKARAPNSNAREMVYVNVDSVSNANGKTYVAHEFQHLISFNQKELLRNVQDDVWLNEARSEYAITVAGYSEPYEGSTLQRRAQAFVRAPSDSLVDWPNTSVDYAIASVFLHYLSDRYGPEIIASTTRTAAAGVAAIDEWLSQNGKTERFCDVFSDWMVASYLNDRGIDPRYGYTRTGLNQIHVAPIVSAQLYGVGQRSDYSASLKDWQPLWVENAIVSAGSAAAVNVRISGSSDAAWRGAVVAKYRDGSGRVIPFLSVFGGADIAAPAQSNGSDIVSVTVAVGQGTSQQVGNRIIDAKPVTVTISSGEISGVIVTPMPTVIPTPQSIQPINGDLIRRVGQSEIYVVWGPYRRYLPQGTLKLYGFENRPVTEVTDDVFFRYSTSNYVREEGQKKVYALWPDGTKHWMNITTAQWDASARDWGAIFTVNSSEITWYATGPDIIR